MTKPSVLTRRTKVKTAIPALAAIVLVSGCASIMKGHHQNVTLRTNPAGGKVALSLDGAQIDSRVTPYTVNLHTGKNYTARVDDPCYLSKPERLEKHPSMWLAGNIVSWIIIGGIIDNVTGAALKFDDNYVLPMVGTGCDDDEFKVTHSK